MIALRKSNFLLIAVVATLLATGMAWSAKPPDNDRATDRDYVGSIAPTSDETQTVDQDGNLVTQPLDVAEPKTKTAKVQHLEIAEPEMVDQVSPDVEDGMMDEPNDDFPSVAQAPILEASSRQFSFQAFLTDSSGDPLSGPSVNLTFNIYDDLDNLLEGPIGPFRVRITNGIVDTQFPIDPKFFNGKTRELGVVVNSGDELRPRVKLVTVPYALRVDRVSGEELDDSIDLGALDANGQLRIWSNAANRRTILLQGSSHTVTIIGTDGTKNAVLSGQSFGMLSLRNQTDNTQTVLLNATANSGGKLLLNSADGDVNIFADGEVGIVDVTNGFRILDAVPGNELMYAFRFPGGVQLRFKDDLGAVAMQGGTSSLGGGLLVLNQSDGENGVWVSGGPGADTGGTVNLYDAENNITINLDGDSHQINLTANNGEERVQITGLSSGVLSLFDSNGITGNDISDLTVLLNAGPTLLQAPLGPGNDFGGQLTLYNTNGKAAIYMNGGNNQGDGTRITTTGSHQVLSSIDPTATVLASLEPGTNGGVLFLSQANGIITVELDGDAGNNSGGDLSIRAADGSLSIFIDGDSAGAGLMQLRDSGGSVRVRLDGESTGTGGEISVYDNNGTETIELLGDESSNGEGSAQIMLRTSSGVDRIEIDANGSNGSRINLFNTAGTGVVLDGEVNGGGRIRVRNASNITRIFIDGDFSGTGLSRIRADVFRVQGGVDLAEPFECKDQEKILPGMVMSIDPDSPGKLMMSTEAYDRKVAGIVSGAGGVRPGITLSQEGVMDQGHLVALTGRVYAMAETSNGAIQPGDLLTTSNIAGHAMKVTDYGMAQGAIIGKAMSRLETGKGLILVLVQPQ